MSRSLKLSESARIANEDLAGAGNRIGQFVELESARTAEFVHPIRFHDVASFRVTKRGSSFDFARPPAVDRPPF